MYIIFTRKRKINPFEVVRNESNNFLALHNDQEIEKKLDEAVNNNGMSNVLCFKKITFRTKTEIISEE